MPLRFLSVPGQMKWWYMKRFVTPQIAETYEYIYAVDEDSNPDEMDVPEFVETLRRHNISIGQPALSPNSGSINHPVTKQQKQYARLSFLRVVLTRRCFPQ